MSRQFLGSQRSKFKVLKEQSAEHWLSVKPGIRNYINIFLGLNTFFPSFTEHLYYYVIIHSHVHVLERIQGAPRIKVFGKANKPTNAFKIA